MTIEHGDKKCDDVEGAFMDDILQSASKGGFGINPISRLTFALRCGAINRPGNLWASKASLVDEVQRADPGVQFA